MLRVRGMSGVELREQNPETRMGARNVPGSRMGVRCALDIREEGWGKGKG